MDKEKIKELRNMHEIYFIEWDSKKEDIPKEFYDIINKIIQILEDEN